MKTYKNILAIGKGCNLKKKKNHEGGAHECMKIVIIIIICSYYLHSIICIYFASISILFVFLHVNAHVYEYLVYESALSPYL